MYIVFLYANTSRITEIYTKPILEDPSSHFGTGG